MPFKLHIRGSTSRYNFLFFPPRQHARREVHTRVISNTESITQSLLLVCPFPNTYCILNGHKTTKSTSQNYELHK